MNAIERHIKNVALSNLIGFSCLQCGNKYETLDDVIEANPRVISTSPWAYVDEECFSEWVQQSYLNNQKLENALKRIEEWCSDCLKPKFTCPSCVYQLIKEELGYKPRLSRGESIYSKDLRTETK